MSSDSSSGIKCGYALVNSTTRVKLTAFGGGDWTVTAGKTLNIASVILMPLAASTTNTLTLMYDNDGVGTGETNIFTVAATGSLYHLWDSQMPVYLTVPASKYITAKTGAAVNIGVIVQGFEV